MIMAKQKKEKNQSASKTKTKKTTSKKVAKTTTKKSNTKKTTTKKTAKKAAKKSTTKKVATKKMSAKKSPVKKIIIPQKTQKTSTKKITPHVTSLKPGMSVPYFEGIDQNGNKITSNDLLGRKYVLYFYPKDNTPGCTKEACNIRDNYQKFLDAGYTVYGVSADSIESHKNFIEKYQLPFSLISDTEKNIIRAFDVWGKKQFMGKIHEGIIRTTFVINEDGIISDVITKVDVDNHAEQILK